LLVRSTVTGPDSNPVLCDSTPKYQAVDEHDTPPSHFKLAMGQPVLFYALRGER